MKDLVERLKDLEYSADDIFMASSVQEAINEIESCRLVIKDMQEKNLEYCARIEAALAWLKSDDNEADLLAILRGSTS